MNARGAWIWGTVVAVVTAVLLLTVPTVPADAASGDGIDLSAPVDSGSCAPCHARIAETSKPGLIYSHGQHLVVACTSCHSENPHRDGTTFSPPMEVCFNCHGVSHGPVGELASSECQDCHTPSFTLRPSNHSKDWAKKPHASAAGDNVNRCMMCHNAPTDCDACHEKEAPELPAMPAVFHPVFKTPPKRPTVTVYPDKPASMGQCIYCHPDIDDFMGGRLIFAHADHLQHNFDCTACHPEFGHDVEATRIPDMQSCYRCHGLTHAAGGEIATEDCDSCHPKEFELKPPDHTKKFVAGEHNDRARRDAAYCAMCHKPDFCVDCHNGKKKLPTGKMSAKVIPADHKKAEWRPDHGGNYLDGIGNCGVCHVSAYCQECHKTPMPHPQTWLAKHDVEDKKEKADCNVCHQDRDECQQCHHDKVKRAELTRDSCIPCHDELKTAKPTEIEHKTFAEHAVHFDVVKNAGKERPYRCDDCHVDFRSGSGSGAGQGGAVPGGHDVRLCYSCHGNLDYKNVLIAEYPGASLCRRCHKDLNI